MHSQDECSSSRITVAQPCSSSVAVLPYNSDVAALPSNSDMGAGNARSDEIPNRTHQLLPFAFVELVRSQRCCTQEKKF